MWGRGEKRLVQQVFPVAGEFALGDHIGRRHHGGAAEARHQDRIALPNVGRLAERERLDPQGLDRLDEAEAGLMIVADDIGGHGASRVGDELRRMRLDHQIADRQHQPVVIDDDA